MQNVYSKKYQEEFSKKSLIKNNQRRELHKKRIRKPELDAIVISSMAKNDFLRAFFSLLMLFVGCDFADTPNFRCFFRLAHRKKTTDIYWAHKNKSNEKHEEGKNASRKKPIFCNVCAPEHVRPWYFFLSVP